MKVSRVGPDLEGCTGFKEDDVRTGIPEEGTRCAKIQDVRVRPHKAPGVRNGWEGRLFSLPICQPTVGTL